MKTGIFLTRPIIRPLLTKSRRIKWFLGLVDVQTALALLHATDQLLSYLNVSDYKFVL